MLVPLPPASSFEDAAALSAEVATEVAESNPTIATVERSIDARPPESVYVDHLQNALGKTLAAVFSVRARPGALVSTPLDWTRITRTLAPERYTVATVGRRSAEHIARWDRLWREASTGGR
jgi:bifunctional non-homologous end joining protein LigD